MAIPTAFSGAKLESLSSSATSPAPIGLFSHPGRVRRLPIQKGLFNLGIRCVVAASDVLSQSQNSENVTSSSSLSALEQLKTSAADSMYFICPKFVSFIHFDMIYFANLELLRLNVGEFLCFILNLVI